MGHDSTIVTTDGFSFANTLLAIHTRSSASCSKGVYRIAAHSTSAKLGNLTSHDRNLERIKLWTYLRPSHDPFC